MRRPLPTFALLGLGLCLAHPAAGQRYLVHTYAEASGLPSSTVHSIAQHRDGVMWFATRAGVASYDGRDWTRYGPAEGLVDPDQALLVIDDEGVVWTAASGPIIRVWRFDGERWEALPERKAGSVDRNRVVSLCPVRRDGGTHLLVGTLHGGVHVWDGETWHGFSVPGSGPMRNLFVDGDRVFVGYLEGLFTVSLDDALASEAPVADPVIFDAPGSELRGLYPEPARGWIWLIGEDWIGRIENGEFALVSRDLDMEFPPPHEHAICESDGDGGIYLGNAWRCFHFHPEAGLSRLRQQSGLISEGSAALCRDREGNLWVGSLRGLSKIVSRRFENWDREQGLFGDEVSAVLERGNGEFVLGHGGGFTFLGDELTTLYLSDDILRARILDLAEESDGTLWAAANVEGLLRIEGHRIVRRFGEADGLGREVTGVAIDRDGILNVGSEGVHRLVDGTFRRFALPANRRGESPLPRRVVAARSGGVFAATIESGLYRLREGEFEHWRHEGAHPSNDVFAVFETADGTILVGTRGGLYRAEDGGILRKVEAPGPRVDRPVYMIVADRDHRLWFGTDHGVLRWDGRELDHLTVHDGLVGAEVNRAGGLLDSRGRVWIGMDRGVSVYRPEFDRAARIAPLVSLGWAEVGGNIYPLDAPISLSHERNSPVFSFRAISFVDETRVRFRYRLEGFDETWSAPEPLPQRSVRYTNLPAGEYRLHLRAVDVRGIESEPAVSAPILVRAPLHATPWFRVGLAAAVLVALYGVVSYVAQRRYAGRLRRAVDERTGELRSSKATAAAQHARLDVILASIADGVAVTDSEGRIGLWNGAAERITGREESAVKGDRLDDALLPESHDASLLEKLRTCAGGSGAVRVNGLSVRTASGETRLVDISGAPLGRSLADGAGAVFAFRDVTAQRQAADELAKAERLESLALLAGGIAHDFNNLLTVILGATSLLETDRTIGPGARELLGEVRAATHRARSLTEQLLTFSRGGAPVRRAASIAEVIRESAAFSLRGANVNAEIVAADDLRVVEIDVGKMSQVFDNLLINARQAMPDGGTVRIRSRNLESVPSFLADGDWVLIEIEDEGPGIAPENLTRVFDPYFSTKEGGSGLGLATAHAIVTAHEGRLTAHSTPGQGSVFRIFLPASDAALPEPEPEPPPSPRSTGRILAMDDDDSVRSMLNRMLANLGYSAVTVSRGEEAVETYRRSRENGDGFDAVLMDLTVAGGMGGVETLEYLLVLDPDVKAIVVSGYASDPVMARHREYGFCGCLEKPFEESDLARVLGDAL